MKTARMLLNEVTKAQFLDHAYLYQEYLSRLLTHKDPAKAEETILENLRSERIEELSHFISDTLGEIRTMNGHEWGLIEEIEGKSKRMLKLVISQYESDENPIRDVIRMAR